MTVKQLIAELEKVENKDLEIVVEHTEVWSGEICEVSSTVENVELQVFTFEGAPPAKVELKLSH